MNKLVLAAAAVSALAACSSGQATKADPSDAAKSFASALASSSTLKGADPKAILGKSGVAAGTSTDRADGVRTSTGLYFASAKDRADGTAERVTVTTYPSNAARDASGDVPSASDDAHWYITFDRGLVTVTGVEDAATRSVLFALPAQQIATRIGGHLIPRG